MKRYPGVDYESIKSYVAVIEVAKALGLKTKHVSNCIKAYGTRNSLFHSAITEYIQGGRLHELAAILHEDEKDVPLIIPQEHSEKKEV